MQTVDKLRRGISRAKQLLAEAERGVNGSMDLQEVCAIALRGLAVGQNAVSHFVAQEEV